MKPGIDYIGVSTVFYCTDGRGNWLFHKRGPGCRDEVGNWDVGSGQLEFQSDITKNVTREVKEEYGCDCTILGQLPPLSIVREFDGVTTHWVAIPFIVYVIPDEVNVTETDKITEVQWFTMANLPAPLHSGVLYTMQKHRDYFNIMEGLRF